MSRNWYEEMHRARSAFSRLVIPVVAPWLSSRPDDWVNMEDTRMDREQRIDWVVGNKAVSARVQYGRGQEHATFTVRDRGQLSEYGAMLGRVGRPMDYDRWVVHAYVGEGSRGADGPADRILSAGLVRDSQLGEWVARHGARWRTNGIDGVRFAFVSWAELAADGVPSLRTVCCTWGGSDSRCQCHDCGQAGGWRYRPGGNAWVARCLDCWVMAASESAVA